MANCLIDSSRKARFRQAYTNGDSSIFRHGKKEPETVRDQRVTSLSAREKKKLNLFMLDAVKSRNKGGVEAALRNGADKDASDEFGCSAIRLARTLGYPEIAEILRRYGASE